MPNSVDLTSKQAKVKQAKAKLRVGRYVFKMNKMPSLCIVSFTMNERIVFATARYNLFLVLVVQTDCTKPRN